MKSVVAVGLYYVGDVISRVMEVKGLHWLYVPYRWAMLGSYYMDKNCRVWK